MLGCSPVRASPSVPPVKSKSMDKLAQMRVSRGGRIYALMVLATLCSTAVFWISLHASRSVTESPASGQSAVAPIWPLASVLETSESEKHRNVFPYSIIPGGVESSQELKKAVLTDPIVAQHYSDFDLTKVRRVTLSTPQLMYVSYRIGNNVFWTKRKLTLPKGETMLTDGHAMARTRCGNRVSALAVMPTSPQQPLSEDFDTPEFPPSISTPYLAAYSAPPPALWSSTGAQAHASPVSSFTPLAPFFPLPGGGGGGHSSAPPPPTSGGGGTPPPGGGGGNGGGGGSPPPPIITPPGPGPVGIPEPGTAGLVLLGLTAAWLMRRSRKAC